MTNQETSIFHSKGMPLRFSANAGTGRTPPLAWMRHFFIGRPAQPVVRGAEVFASPVVDVPVDGVDGDDPAQPLLDAPEPGANSAANRGAPSPSQAPSSSLSAEANRPESPAGSPSGQGERAGKSSLSSGLAGLETSREHSANLRSMQAGSAEPAPGRIRGVRVAPQVGGDEGPPEFTASRIARETSPSITSETRSYGGSDADTVIGESEIGHPKTHSTGGLPGGMLPTADAEDRKYVQGRKITELGLTGLGRVANANATRAAVKVTASRRPIDPETASPQQVHISGQGGMANSFSSQEIRAEVFSTVAAPKTDALEVLEKLSTRTSQAPAAASRPRKQVHIGKLHITVQRPAVEAPPQQQPPVVEGRHASQPAGRVFLDPWERHYSSFD